MTTFVTSTSSSDGDYNGNGDLFVITITPKDAQRILGQLWRYHEFEAQMGGHSLFKIVLWDPYGHWCPYPTVLMDAREDLDVLYDADNFTFVDDDPVVTFLRANDIRTECDCINILDGGVYWSTIVKHTSCRLESNQLYVKELQALARGEEI
jgi:hypothetical protein